MIGGVQLFIIVEKSLVSQYMIFFFFWQFGQQTFDLAGMPFGSQATREPSRGSSPEWLHMQIGGGFERTT